MFHTMTALLALEALTGMVAASQNVVPMSFEKRTRAKPHDRLRKRQKVINEPVTNDEILYLANVTVGSPPQALALQLDTGSSDVWMTANAVSFCQQSSKNCDTGTFNPQASTSYTPISSPSFNISYVDGTGSSGNYFTDDFSIQGVTLSNIQMGLATSTDIGTGIMGVGYAADESICNTAGPCQTYPSVMDQMKSQGKINRKAYSLWLEDLESNTGNILFGGVDSSKYLPPLVSLPVQNDAQSGSISSFTVAWTGLTLSTPSGPVEGFWQQGTTLPAILDSGTTLMMLPPQIANPVVAQFGAVLDQSVGGYVADCSLSKTTALFAFQFGGAGGPSIQVPVSEFLIPVLMTDGSTYKRNGKPFCEIGIQISEDPNQPILLGDTFLRSAYVVYDLENNAISVAQSNFNPGKSNIQEIPSGSAQLPGVSSTANSASASQTATGRPKGVNPPAPTTLSTSGMSVGTSTGSGISGSSTSASSSIVAASTFSISSVGTAMPTTYSGTPLTSYTAINTYAPSNIRVNAAATSSSAATSLHSPPQFMLGFGITMTTTATAAVAFGMALLLL